MAVHKATRSNSQTQPKPKHAKTEAQPPCSNHQFKAEIFDILRNLNRGFGIALAALDRLEVKDHARAKHLRRNGLRIFTAVCLGDYRSQTEALQAETNRGLLWLMAAHEDQNAGRFGRTSFSPPLSQHRS
jgi:hypothetical protein